MSDEDRQDLLREIRRYRSEVEWKLTTVVCMDSSHRTKPAIVAVLFRYTNGEWHPRAHNRPEREVWLDKDDQPAVGMTDSSVRTRGHRRRLKLQCPLGCREVPIRGENLDPILDECWRRADEANIIERPEVGPARLRVPLAHIAAKVTCK